MGNGNLVPFFTSISCVALQGGLRPFYEGEAAMKKSEILEGVILLLSAVVFLPIWMASSQQVQFPPMWLKVLSFLQYPVVIVLSIMLVRRLRRVIRAFRENKNNPGPF